MLYPSARNSKLKRSVSRKRRKRDASRLKNPGPSVVKRPILPNWPATGAEKLDVSNQGARSIPWRILTEPLMLGELFPVPGVFKAPVLVTKFIGEPLIRL